MKQLLVQHSSRFRLISALAVVSLFLNSCLKPTVDSSTVTTSVASTRFATGTKAVKIVTSITTTTGSYTTPIAVPTPAVIPSSYPGYDGTTTYLPGVSAGTYFSSDGTTSIAKPSWLLDVQLGVSARSAAITTAACATFGNSINRLDPLDYYRVSEKNCDATACAGGSCDGSGVTSGSADPVFARIILDRDTAKIGSAENLLVQIEYQASGLHLNSDGGNADAEDNLDQLWKIFWKTSLGTDTAKPFAIFVPPNYGACVANGTTTTGQGTIADMCDKTGINNTTYSGAPVKVKQFIIPLSAYPTMKVIQISRVKGRVTAVDGTAANVGTFCADDSPLCLGIVIRSITLMRM